MSTTKCCVPGCEESGRSKGEVLHSFPNPEKHAARFRNWVMQIGGNIVGLDDKFIYACRRVCHVHFEQRYYCRFNRINCLAIPTLHLPEQNMGGELQEDVPSLDSPENQQVDAGPLGLLLPVKLEPDTDKCSVKQEKDTGSTVVYKPLQEDVPSLDSPETQQVDADPLGLLLPVKLEPDTDEFIKREIEIEIIPTDVCEPVPAPQLLDTVTSPLSDGTVSSGDDIPAEHLLISKATTSKDCQDETSNKSVLLKHKKNKTYSCTVCKYRTEIQKHLKIHMCTGTQTGGKPYSCSYCKYKCFGKSSLDKHIRTHTGDKPYSCSYCEYKCSEKSNLVKHILTHTEEKPYSCSYCKYKCLKKSNLVRHMRTHTGEKPYSCSSCDFKCSIKSSLNRHKRTHRRKPI